MKKTNKKNSWDPNQFKKSDLKGNKNTWKKAAKNLIRSYHDNQNDMIILGIKKINTLAELNKARNKIMLKVHPDKGGSEEETKKVLDAYERLKVLVSK